MAAAFDGATILVTGGGGFVGRHLLAALAESGQEHCHATTLELRHRLARESAVQWHGLDITDRETTIDLLGVIKPDVIFHLAAQAHVPTSFTNPELTWQVNLHGTLNLLEAATRANPRATFINVGSSDMYGASFHNGEAVTEITPFLPLNPYAASKAAADLAAFQYSANSSLKIIRARPFNHTGPGQSEDFVLPAFAAQIARIEAGLQEAVIAVGDLSGERDFLHIADVVSAYMGLAERAKDIPSGTAFNISSGQARTIAELLEAMLDACSTPIRVQRDPSRLRPVDIRRVCGASDAIQAATGWAPQRSSAGIIADLLEHWRDRIQTRGSQ